MKIGKNIEIDNVYNIINRDGGGVLFMPE